MILILCIIVLVALILIFKYLKSIKEYVRFRILLGKLPTAENRKFLIGHASTLFGLTGEEAWHVAREWASRAPPVYTIFLGPFVAILGIVGADEYEAIFAPMKNLEKAQMYTFLHRWLEDGLLTSTGAKWQQRRKILTPAFHFSILLEFVETFNKETRRFVEDIEKKYLNQEVDVVPLISNFTLLTMIETSMGSEIDLESREGIKYKKAIQEMGEILYKRFTTPWLWHNSFFDMTRYRKLEIEALKVLHDFTNAIINKRNQNFTTFDEKMDESFKKRKVPLLDVLLNIKIRHGSIDQKGIREEVDTFMFEGHDTTATCLNFTAMLLACHKDHQEEVYQEIISIIGPDLSREPTYNELMAMSLLERCIKESLRLYPPVPMIGRKTSENIPTKHGVIPKGTYTLAQIYDIQRSPKYFEKPNEFDPSRHLPENSIGRHPFAFIPFSVGPRNCIGQRFAMLEMKSLFCGILRKFILEPVDTPETVNLVEQIVLRSTTGVKVKFVLRKN